ncbi:hypothetical protein [Phaeovulum sp. W22_SRMD_FR3]|uniref:hypothetical protein n=1 Tax=Phaeovulum sp. W22_SRMD_FR3 TaxID=3240274 RepID=UPI003F959B33
MRHMLVALWSMAVASQAAAGGTADATVPWQCAPRPAAAQAGAAADLCRDVAQAISARYGVRMMPLAPDAALTEGAVGLEILTLADHHISARLLWHQGGTTVLGPVLDLSVTDAASMPAAVLRNYAGSLVTAANFALTAAH